MWRNVDADPIPFDRVTGVTPAGPTGRRWLVAEYGYGKDKRVVRVPLAADGRPLPPFEWQGSTDERTASTVPDGQRQALDHAADLQRPGSKLDRLVVPSGPINMVVNGSVVVAAYRVKPDGELAWAQMPAHPTTMPSDVHVVVLPADRQLQQRRRSREFKAVALTPLALVGDAAIVVGCGALIAGILYLDATTHDDDCDDTVAWSHHRR